MKALNISLAVLAVAVLCVTAVCYDVDEAYAAGGTLTLAIDEDWTDQHIGENISKFVFTPGSTGVGVNYGPSAQTPWKTTTASSYTVEFQNGITNIGEYMFHGCKAPTGTINFPANCTIGAGSFSQMQAGSFQFIRVYFNGNTIMANAFDNNTYGSNQMFTFQSGDNVVESYGFYTNGSAIANNIVIQKNANVHFKPYSFDGAKYTQQFTVHGNVTGEAGAFAHGLINIVSDNPAFYPVLGSDECGGIAKDTSGRVYYYDDENPVNSRGQYSANARWYCYDDNGKLVLVFEGGQPAPNSALGTVWYKTDEIHSHFSPNVIRIENDISYSQKLTPFERMGGSTEDYWASVEEVVLGPAFRCGIKNDAFANMPNLKKITFNALNLFEGATFRESNSLEEVNLIRSSAGTYRDYPNNSDTPWKRSTYDNMVIHIADDVTNFSANLFENTTAKTVYIGHDLWEVHDYAFNNSQIEKVYWNMDSGKYYQIDSYAFSNCANLKFIILPDNVRVLDNAFANSGLEAVVALAPSSNIGAYAFNGCNVSKVLNLTGEDLVAGTDAYGGLVSNPNCEITTNMGSDAMIERTDSETSTSISVIVTILKAIPVFVAIGVLGFVGYKALSRKNEYDD